MARYQNLNVSKLYYEDLILRKDGQSVNVGRQNYAFVSGGAQSVVTTATQNLVATAPLLTSDYPLCNYTASDDTDTVNSVNVVGNACQVVLSAVPDAHALSWAVAAPNANPQLAVWAAGEHTCVGGAAAEAITITGLLTTDICLVQIGTSPATNNYDIIKAIPTADTLTVTFGTDPTTVHTVQYAILRRPDGTFTPTHEIVTCVGPTATTADATGRATNDLVIAGLRTTDLCFHSMSTASGVIQIDGSDRSTAGTVTVGFSANPSTTNAFKTVVLRAVA